VIAPVKNEEPKLPPMYAVILHNDPSTPYYFVILVLVEVFGLESREAGELMMRCNKTDKVLVRVYSKEVAETKVEQARVMIQRLGINGLNPAAPCELTFSIQPESGEQK
jgi:ATP-dependent Clp protease adaptor protein ClpS